MSFTCAVGMGASVTVGAGEAHEFAVVVQVPQLGVVAPVAQTLVRDCVMLPVCPAGHARVWDCEGSGEHEAAATTHDAAVNEPLRIPLLQVRSSLSHCAVAETVAVR